MLLFIAEYWQYCSYFDMQSVDTWTQYARTLPDIVMFVAACWKLSCFVQHVHLLINATLLVARVVPLVKLPISSPCACDFVSLSVLHKRRLCRFCYQELTRHLETKIKTGILESQYRDQVLTFGLETKILTPGLKTKTKILILESQYRGQVFDPGSGDQDLDTRSRGPDQDVRKMVYQRAWSQDYNSRFVFICLSVCLSVCLCLLDCSHGCKWFTISA